MGTGTGFLNENIEIMQKSTVFDALIDPLASPARMPVAKPAFFSIRICRCGTEQCFLSESNAPGALYQCESSSLAGWMS